MDVNRSLRSASQTGSLLLGSKESLQAVVDGEAKLVVVASNVPDDHLAEIEAAASEHDVPVHAFEGMNHALGSACGKPFAVSCLAVLDAGESDILQLARPSA